MGRLQRTWVAQKSRWLESEVIGYQTVRTREHHGFDRSSGRIGSEYLICGLYNMGLRKTNARDVKGVDIRSSPVPDMKSLALVS